MPTRRLRGACLVRVVVTRRAEQARGLVEALELLGHEVVLCPLIAIEALGDAPVDVGDYDWLVVTSPNGAEELVRRGLAGPPPAVAAVGPATAEALSRGGIRVDLVPRVSTQEGLAAELPRPPGRVLLLAAEGARRFLADELAADFVPLYRTTELTPAELPRGDLVVLASGSQARAFAALGLDLPAVTIGSQTTAVAREAGLRVAAEAETQDVAGIAAAVEKVRRAH